jgi:hypothetical protein
MADAASVVVTSVLALVEVRRAAIHVASALAIAPDLDMFVPS